ncbi:transporter (plasmid) [Fulvitalea axinellae]|uniref:Transporter n=1 Tax=Fulvitalea axinellae TaxID=1182444 RepID=A0AAU9DGW7_9BACT|nr:transporter [Fulvitalea axinellae]
MRVRLTKPALLWAVLAIFFGDNALAQGKLTLEECRAKAKANYIILNKQGLWEEHEAKTLEVLKAGQLPLLLAHAEAKYVSDVPRPDTDFPGFPKLPKDQYQFFLSANQLIYQGGYIKKMKANASLSTQVELDQLELDWYKYEQRVDVFFFNIFLLEEVSESMNLARISLNERLREAQAGVELGAVLPYQTDYLKAEMLKIDQEEIGVEKQRQTLLESLSIIMGEEISSVDRLLISEPKLAEIDNVTRPELRLIESKKTALLAQNDVLKSQRLPKVEAFGVTGYGQPGYNFFNPNFDFYYQVGAKVSWNVFDWNRTKNQMRINEVKAKMGDEDRDQFLRNLKVTVTKQENEIEEYRRQLAKDEEELILRENIRNGEASRFDNGVISGADYVKAVNEEKNTRVRMRKRRIQIIQAQYGLNTLLGQ